MYPLLSLRFFSKIDVKRLREKREENIYQTSYRLRDTAKKIMRCDLMKQSNTNKNCKRNEDHKNMLQQNAIVC